jgi:hypothetical protein
VAVRSGWEWSDSGAISRFDRDLTLTHQDTAILERGGPHLRRLRERERSADRELTSVNVAVYRATPRPRQTPTVGPATSQNQGGKMRLHTRATCLRLNLGTIALACIAGSVIFVARDVEAQPTPAVASAQRATPLLTAPVTVTKKPDLVITGVTVQSYLIVTQVQTKVYSTPPILSTSYVEIEATIANKGAEAAVFYPNVRVFDVQTGPAPTKNAKADDLGTMTVVPPGGTVKKRLTIARPSELAPGNYPIKLLADPTLKIAESDEANNGYDLSLSVAAPPATTTAPAATTTPTTTPTEQTCSLSGATLNQAYIKAIENGFRFQCMDTPFSMGVGSEPWSLSSGIAVQAWASQNGDIVCSGQSAHNAGMITGGLFANKQGALRIEQTQLTGLRNGWEFVDSELEGATTFGGFLTPTYKVGVVRFKVVTPGKGVGYAFQLKGMRVKKTGGNCSNVVNEAFGPALGTPQDTVCSVSIIDAYLAAIKKGYAFACAGTANLSTASAPTPIAGATPQLFCGGASTSPWGLWVSLFRNSDTGESTAKNGWRVLSYRVAGATGLGGYWERGQGLISFNVEMAQNTAYGIGIFDLKLAKAGKSCANALNEAF